ncbi:MAG: hypothetical protein WCF84_02385 [Anaerolineae bacterium]
MDPFWICMLLAFLVGFLAGFALDVRLKIALLQRIERKTENAED